MRNSEEGGPGKIRSYWEDKVFKGLSRLHETSPVYTIEPEKDEGRKHTVNRNLLLPCDALTPDDPLPSRRNKSARRCKRGDTRSKTVVRPFKGRRMEQKKSGFTQMTLKKQQHPEQKVQSNKHKLQRENQ